MSATIFSHSEDTSGTSVKFYKNKEDGEVHIRFEHKIDPLSIPDMLATEEHKLMYPDEWSAFEQTGLGSTSIENIMLINCSWMDIHSAQRLQNVGIVSLDQFAGMSEEKLSLIPGDYKAYHSKAKDLLKFHANSEIVADFNKDRVAELEEENQLKDDYIAKLEADLKDHETKQEAAAAA